LLVVTSSHFGHLRVYYLQSYRFLFQLLLSYSDFFW
jgi:hypothetical protein